MAEGDSPMPAPFARRPRKALAAAAGALMLSLAAGQPALAQAVSDPIHLIIDFAKLLKLDEPPATIVIGNPGIADAAIGDDRMIVLTGKSAGATNMIVLDARGNEIANTTLRVASDTRHLTTIFRGAKRQTYSCAPTCEQVIAVGDDEDAFATARQQIHLRQTFSGVSTD
jgi:Flp pilus assembly secretin CpaC